MPALHLTQDDFDAKALKSATPVLVDFWAPWCGPCRIAGPIIDELAEEYKDKAVVAKVNVDEQGTLAEKFNVMSIPTVIVLKAGQEVERQVGFVGKDGYQQMLDKHL